MTVALYPLLLWAQRTDCILLTVALQDATNVHIELPDNGASFQFACDTPDGRHYACSFALYKAVSTEESHHAVRPRQIELKLKKRSAVLSTVSGEEEAADEACWPRLTKERPNKNIQVDWSQWKDADEEAEGAMDDLGNFGLGGDLGDDEMTQKMMQQFMVRDERNGAEEGLGVEPGTIPSFASAAGQQPMPENACDDMPPLEEAND